MRLHARRWGHAAARVALVAFAALAPRAALLADDITSPEVFFGHPLGADGKLARWDRIVEYFRLLDAESDRISVIDLGPSTEGHPYLLAIITSPANHSRLESLRESHSRILAKLGEGGMGVVMRSGSPSAAAGNGRSPCRSSAAPPGARSRTRLAAHPSSGWRLRRRDGGA